MPNAYVYKLRFIPKNLFYIGSRKAENFSSDFWVKYFTSSKIVKSLIKEHGKTKDIWDFELLGVFNTYEEAVHYENSCLQSIENKTDYINLNFSAGGSIIKTTKFIKLTDGKTSFYWPRHIDYDKDKFKPDRDRYKTPSQKNKTWWINLKDMSVTLTHKDLSELGYQKREEYTKIQRELAKKGRTGNKWYNNGIENKKFYPNDIPNGWVPGRLKFKSYKKRETSPTTGKFCYTDGTRNIFISNDDDIPDGFHKGITR